MARQAAAGDAAAFAALVRLHENAIRRFLARITRTGDADDLAQEVFVKAWLRADRWRGEGSYRGWLYRIAWTEFLVSRRGRSRRESREQRALELGAAAPADPNSAIDVARALDSLEPRERAAALLCYGEGYSHAEAAEIMEIPLGTLKSIMARARAALVAQLEGVS